MAEGWPWAPLAVAGLVAAPLLSVLAALIERSGPIRLRHWAEEAGGRLRGLYRSPARFTVFRTLLSTAAKLAPVALFAGLAGWGRPLGGAPPLIAAAGLTVAVVALVEIANRLLVDGDAESALRRLTFVYRGLLLVLAPLVTLLAPLVPARRRPEDDLDDDDATDDEIEAFIDVGTREGILEPEEGEMLWGIVDFGETQVKSVMTPRVDMICAPVEASLEELADRFLESGHARLPLYEGSIDRIVGILHLRELLRGLRSGASPPATALAKPPFFVPETRPLPELLREMQARFQQMAIVLDEYGGTAGIVTVEDLVEEIVGEIADEHEIAEPEPEELAEGGWRLDGSTHVSTLDELFEIDLDEEPYETVAGLMLSVLGRVPEPGEVVETRGLRLVAERVEGRRIVSLQVDRLVPDESDGEPAEETAR